MSNAELVRDWIAARNARDLERLVELSSPDIEMYLGRGTLRGVAGLRDWVERMSFGIVPHVQPGVIYERDGTLVAEITTELRYVDGDEPAAPAEPGGALFEIEAGRLRSYRPDSDLASLLEQAALGPADRV